MRYLWHDPTAYWLLGLLVIGGAAAAVAALTVLLGRNGGETRRPQAEETLRLRLARGEIDIDEYESRLAALRGTRV